MFFDAARNGDVWTPDLSWATYSVQLHAKFTQSVKYLTLIMIYFCETSAMFRFSLTVELDTMAKTPHSHLVLYQGILVLLMIQSCIQFTCKHTGVAHPLLYSWNTVPCVHTWVRVSGLVLLSFSSFLVLWSCAWAWAWLAYTQFCCTCLLATLRVVNITLQSLTHQHTWTFYKYSE